MKKNVSGQKIGAQMVSATDGSAFTDSVTVYVTGDAGTQAVGSVGGGACTHEGNGYHTYAPAQAETDYDLIAFTFVGAGAVPATVQVFTGFPQTGDGYALIGAAGAGLTALPWNAAWDAEVQSEVADALEAAIADSIPADGAMPSVKQALYMIAQRLTEAGIVGTTMTIYKPDGTTPLYTLTLGDATNPTTMTRAT